MRILTFVLTVLGLCVFETVSSVDNAIINAEVLSTMGERGRKWFLLWGLLFAVFAIRGLLPWLIVWMSTPSLGPIGALTATFSSDPLVIAAIEQSAPILLIGGGVFLLFLFSHWLFLEEKNFGLMGERYIATKGVWFFAIVSVLLAAICCFGNLRPEYALTFTPYGSNFSASEMCTSLQPPRRGSQIYSLPFCGSQVSMASLLNCG